MNQPGTLLATLLLAAALLGLGCDSGETTTDSTSAAGTVGEALPADLVATAAPEGAKNVTAVRAEAQDGQRVVVEGVIGGRAEPISADRAIFTLIDPSVKTCNTLEGDTCATPWDACCEPSDFIAANSAAVQVVGADGRPLRAGLEGVGGLAPLKRVIVVGTYRLSPDGQAATVDAEQIYVAG